MEPANRRRFLLTAIGACGPLGPGAAAWLGHRLDHRRTAGATCGASLPDGLQQFTQTSVALGTQVSLAVLHADGEIACRAAAAAMAEIQRVEVVMSIYRPESQLSRLNRCGILERPDPYLIEILGAVQAISKQSAGAFDATVQPLWTLYAEAAKAGGLPHPSDVADALQKVDWRRVEFSPRRVRLHGKGTAVTLNGIAQGFAADQAADALRRFGIEHALINSGEFAALGNKSDGRAWTVGIQHPRREDAYAAIARLRGRCLATSGDYATRFSDDYRFNHLFDPHTGRSPDHFASVSIAAPTATQADALSTAVYVLGPEKGLDLVRSIPGADALFVFGDGRMLATAGFPAEI
jgi:thiamine biosynthesis lipoprotein